MFFYTLKQVTVDDAYITRQKVMGQENQRLGKLPPGSPKDLRFCAFFGVSAQVLVTARNMMEDCSVLLPGSKLLTFFVGTRIYANISCK